MTIDYFQQLNQRLKELLTIANEIQDDILIEDPEFSRHMFNHTPTDIKDLEQFITFVENDITCLSVYYDAISIKINHFEYFCKVLSSNLHGRAYFLRADETSDPKGAINLLMQAKDFKLTNGVNLREIYNSIWNNAPTTDAHIERGKTLYSEYARTFYTHFLKASTEVAKRTCRSAANVCIVSEPLYHIISGIEQFTPSTLKDSHTRIYPIGNIGRFSIIVDGGKRKETCALLLYKGTNNNDVPATLAHDDAGRMAYVDDEHTTKYFQRINFI